MRYWLMKSEADCFSIQDLAASPGQTTFWDGVRNYQARNFMREMRVGDRILFHKSGQKSGEAPGVVGVVEVAREAYPDHTAQDPASEHFDPKSSPENPIWEMVDVRLVKIFSRPLTLASLRGVQGLENMELLRKGSRLSVQPVSPAEFDIILGLAQSAKTG